MSGERDDPDEYDDEAENLVWDAMLAALDQPGPWPRRSSVHTQPVTVLDIDQVGDHAIVLAVTESNTAMFEHAMLYAWTFERSTDGWSAQGGSGSGGDADPFFARQQWVPGQAPLIETAGGATALEPGKRRGQWLREASVLCSPEVARVEIRRAAETRVAEVADGPGWLVVAWISGAEPTVTALDETGRQLGGLDLEPYTPAREPLLRLPRLRRSPERWRRSP